jgi:hypothetical protein
MNLDLTTKGTIMLVVGGIGIMMFLDIIAYIFRLNANKIGEMTGKKYKVFDNEEFEDLTDPAFKLVVFASNKSIQHVPLYSMLKTMQKWKDKFSFTNFEFHERYTDLKQEHYTKEYFEEHLPKTISKIFVIGSINFKKEVKACLNSCGLESNIFSVLH